MKYAIIADLTLTTTTQQNSLANAIITRIGSKPVWGVTSISKGVTKDNKPQVGVEVRFNNQPDATDLFSYIKQRMNAIPVLGGKVTRHDCSHDETPIPCVILEQYIK